MPKSLRYSRRMSNLITALLASTALPDSDAGFVPEWVQLLPASEGEVHTRDSRGPFLVEDADAIVAASMADADSLLIDECHSTDTAAPNGGAAPARGWIEAMEVREDGIWARVAWNSSGRALLEDRAYRGISPVILHDKAKRVVRILRASLTNTPNLRGMVALNTETEMSLIERLAALAGLSGEVTEDTVITALETQLAQASANAEISAVGVALGLADDAAAADVVVAAQSAVTVEEHEALRQELNSAVTQLNELTEGASRSAAETFVDAEIAKGRAGLKPVRKRYIAMHMEDPEGTAELISAMPIVRGPLPKPSPTGETTTALNAEQAQVAARMGISEEAFLKALNTQETA